MDYKLSFNKRISMAKGLVFKGVTESNELDSIKGTNTQGYYSLATIEKHLHPALGLYDLDLDLEIFSDKIIGHWYDCLSDKERTIEIDFHRIENVDRLQMMANSVQSEGAVKSYTRRYALTAILRLPSTDLIDSGNPNGQKPKQKTPSGNTGNTSGPKKVSDKQLKRFYAIAKQKEFDTSYLDELVKTAFNVSTKNDLLVSDYDKLTKYMEGNSSQETNSMLIKKINKSGRKVPEKKSKDMETSR